MGTLHRLEFIDQNFAVLGVIHRQVDEVNAAVYDNVNNGVYKAGFATEQSAYEQEVTALFEELDRLEARLATRRYLAGSSLTEADWRRFTTPVRFEAGDYSHFKLSTIPF